jgi:hypothetical protein
VPALIIAYCIGYLATMIPMPAGIGVLDSGLAGSLVLYGMKPTASVSAVLVYHAISIWVPGTGGLFAWLPTRGRKITVDPEDLVAGAALSRSAAHVGQDEGHAVAAGLQHLVHLHEPAPAPDAV